MVIRDDLLGYTLPETPLLLNYQVYAESQTLHNTPNMFAIYVMALLLEWILGQGGLNAHLTGRSTVKR